MGSNRLGWIQVAFRRVSNGSGSVQTGLERVRLGLMGEKKKEKKLRTALGLDRVALATSGLYGFGVIGLHRVFSSRKPIDHTGIPRRETISKRRGSFQYADGIGRRATGTDVKGIERHVNEGVDLVWLLFSFGFLWFFFPFFSFVVFFLSRVTEFFFVFT